MKKLFRNMSGFEIGPVADGDYIKGDIIDIDKGLDGKAYVVGDGTMVWLPSPPPPDNSPGLSSGDEIPRLEPGLARLAKARDAWVKEQLETRQFVVDIVGGVPTIRLFNTYNDVSNFTVSVHRVTGEDNDNPSPPAA